MTLIKARKLIPFQVVSTWLQDVAEGRWTWVRNTRCKYVTMHFDTRAGAYCVKDRDGNAIDAETLLYQYESES